jgi:hypothetical protein
LRRLAVTVLRDDGSEHPLDFPAVVVRHDTAAWASNGATRIPLHLPDTGLRNRLRLRGRVAQMSSNQVE